MRLLFTQFLFLAGLTAFAQPTVVFENIASGLTQPVDITSAGDGSNRLFIVEKTGRIKILDQTDNSILSTPFLDVSGQIRTNSERGLLGLAFHPDFATNGEFYVNYTAGGSSPFNDGTTVISRFTLSSPSSNTASLSSEEVILTINQPYSNHNAGDLAFGPDGFLYIPTGDGGSGGDPQDNGQKPTSLLGKMLRIDVTGTPDPGLAYAIPPTNPFVSDAAIRDEIWAFGLRNPWRISFDRQTGDLWIGDVGQNAREEIDFQPASSTGGENYGWDCREGFISYTGNSSNLCNNSTTYTDPLFDYNETPPGGGYNQSVTGGFVYRGERADDLVGWYVAADFARNDLYLLPPSGSASDVVRVQGTTINSITTFGEDDAGNLYVAGIGGEIAHVTTQRTLPAEIIAWTARAGDKEVTLDWSTASEDNTADFRIERSTDGATFAVLATKRAAGSSTERNDYRHVDADPMLGTLYYRLIQVDNDGTEVVYPIRRVYFGGALTDGPTLSPNPAIQNVTVQIPELQQRGTISIRLYASDGREVYVRHALRDGGPQQLELVLPTLPAGIYRTVITYDNLMFTRNLTVR